MERIMVPKKKQKEKVQIKVQIGEFFDGGIMGQQPARSTQESAAGGVVTFSPVWASLTWFNFKGILTAADGKKEYFNKIFK